MKGRSLLRGYEGQIKIFLVLLVLFLAVAVYFNFHLLIVARDAIEEQAGARLAIEADLVRAELERDQLLRGLRGGPIAVPYIPPAFLERIVRLRDMAAIEILKPDGTVLSSSDGGRVGETDAFLAAVPDIRARLSGGGRIVTPLERAGWSARATLAAYRPIVDPAHVLLAVIGVRREVPALASVDLNLRTIAALQAGGLVFVLVLVILFARWLLQPYRRLLRAAGEAPGAVTGLAAVSPDDEPDYLVAAFQGVVDKLREQEDALRHLKDERRGVAALPGAALVAGMTSAVLVFDRDGRLTVLNDAAERLLGLGREAAEGRTHRDLLRGTPRLVDLVERGLAAGESVSREVVAVTDPSGRVAHLGAMIAPIRSAAAPSVAAFAARRGGAAALERPPEGGTVEGVLCLLADLTEIKSLREKVGLKENLAALGELSAGIAHEFRNALATIQGLARLVTRLPADAAPPQGTGSLESARGHAEAILREVRGVQKVVDDFLRFARPATLDLDTIDLERLVEDLAREFRDDPAAAAITLVVEGEFPPLVADGALLRQALLNLLRNAAESFGPAASGPAPSGPGRSRPVAAAGVRVRGRVLIRGSAESGASGGVRIAVEDDGPGIDPADLPRIFTPFFTTKERGTGLGLALVQKAAVVHDGHVEVHRLPGGGTRFVIVLPARPGAPVAAAAAL